jgi:hypothetical protein
MYVHVHMYVCTCTYVCMYVHVHMWNISARLIETFPRIYVVVFLHVSRLTFYMLH